MSFPVLTDSGVLFSTLIVVLDFMIPVSFKFLLDVKVKQFLLLIWLSIENQAIINVESRDSMTLVVITIWNWLSYFSQKPCISRCKHFRTEWLTFRIQTTRTRFSKGFGIAIFEFRVVFVLASVFVWFTWLWGITQKLRSANTSSIYSFSWPTCEIVIWFIKVI